MTSKEDVGKSSPRRSTIDPDAPLVKELDVIPVETLEQHVQVLQAARSLREKNSDWVTFFREILGLNGLVRRTFSTPESLSEFEKSESYAEILQTLTELRKRKLPDPSQQEPTRVITVRLPKSMHEALRIEAHEHHTSMNKLCISKLLQFISQERVPSEP